MVVPIGVLTILSGHIFYVYDFQKPSIWIAIYASITKNIWGVIALVFFVGLEKGIGQTIKKLLEHPIFQPLAKITFCIYLCHTFVIRVTLGNIRGPVFVSDMSLVSIF